MPAVIGGALVVVQIFWGFVWNVISAENVRMEHEIESLRKQEQSEYTPRSEEEQYRLKIDAEVKRIDAVDSRLDAGQRRMRETLLSKEAYNAAHVALIADVVRLNSRFDELRRETSSTYTVNDKIKDLQDQIKSLQNRIITGPIGPIGPTGPTGSTNLSPGSFEGKIKP